MKKVFFALFTIASLVWTACSNEPIDVSVTNYYDLKLAITTDGMYTQHECKESFQTQILSDGANEWLRVVTLVYDSNGLLVDKVCSDTHTFELIYQNFTNLAEGTYTVVTVESYYSSGKPSNDETRNYTFYGWNIEGESQLSTLILNNGGYRTYWYEAVGINSQSLNLNKNYALNISPKVIGSKVNVIFYNLDKTTCDFAALCTKNKPVGLHLDPSIPSSAKYVYDGYTSSNTWVGRGEIRNAGGSLDDKVGFTAYILESGTLNWCVTATTIGDDGSIKFKAYPDYGNAYFKFEDGGVYTAGLFYNGKDYNAFIGIPSQYNTWLNSQTYTEPTPTPTTLYHKPYTSWGASVGSVKSYMSGYEMFADMMWIDNMSLYLLGYMDGDIEMDYLFANSTGNLTDAYVFIPLETQNTVTQAAEQLAEEGYELVNYDEEDNTLIYLKDNTGVLVYINSNNNLVINYYSVNYYKTNVKAQAPNKKRFSPQR